MLVEKGIEHGLLHLNGKDNWKHMRCGGSCSSCGNVDPGRATAKIEDHGMSDNAYQQRRQLSVSLGPRSATGLPQSLEARLQLSQVRLVPPPTSAAPVTLVGPCGTAKTTNKVLV